MTASEKAKELVDRLSDITANYVLNGEANQADVRDEAKECALIAIEEIIEAFQPLTPVEGWDEVHEEIDYWKKVKEEINNL